MTLSCNPVRFVILFVGRSGSSNLVEALDSHPGISARGEWLFGKDSDRQLRMAREFLTQPPHGEYSAVGFKTKLKDVRDPEGFAKLLREAGARIIFLQRRNSIKHVVSRFNSYRLHGVTKHWNLYNEEDRLPPATIDLMWFSGNLEEIEEEKRELEGYVKNLGLPTLSLCYEDLLVEQRASLERVFSFLGVRFEPVRGRCIKNTNDDLREAVSNFHALRSHYIGTPYEQMFDEVLVSGQNYRQRGTLALPSERRIEQHKLAQELQAHKQRVEELRSKLAKKHQRAERLRKQNQRLKLALQNIQGSRTWRLSKRLDRVRAKVLGKLRI